MGVLEEIVESNRLPVLFIGAGFSKRYLYRYPSWMELLELSFAKFEPDVFQLQKHIDGCKRKGMSEFEINAYLGTVIEDGFNQAFFDRKISINVGNKKNPSWVKRRISPYKMFLADFFRRQKLNRSPELSEELDKLKKLKSKIAAVITTNYDSFLENQVFTNDYNVFVRQHELFSPDSYGIAEIYKIHGSVTDAESIVITEQDYKNFKESRKLIIAKMLTLFSESPIIFMGYSFRDENIKEIIEDFLSCLSDEQLSNIRKHFIFISYKKDEQNLVEIERTITTKNNIEIPFVEIQTDNYGLVYDQLARITPGISPLRVRETRRLVKTIVDQKMTSAEAQSIIVGIDDLSKVDLTSKPLAIAIGYKDNILNKYGYGLLEDNQIFEDIIFDNKKFDCEAMCSERYKNIAITRLLPVFKYVKNQHIIEDSKLDNYVKTHDSLDKIVSRKIAETFKNFPEYDSYEQLYRNMINAENCRKTAMSILKNMDNLTIDELREACKYLFEKYPNEFATETNAKRCILCLDIRENYLKK
ncbi:SIR2 family protein [Pseudobutyrivibrio xylanivorans]|uniref:SIR2-like domain-containing protein n=1 Tax=Pseudobutyrivibrio xylanivorans DSM 14809 TaxID=1123012 RepID=A0A1M6JFF4_PSEXY|nr:SIR2 family protein [Pseudobutyrivibrio xylanivorans]SHJ45342.1 SIR2-like domain-containing protein [Pseudobutyrivibrio xylanivorans DSM 14809]